MIFFLYILEKFILQSMSGKTLEASASLIAIPKL